MHVFCTTFLQLGNFKKKTFGLAKATPRCALGCLCSWWTLASWERRSSMSWATLLIWDFIWNRFARARMIPNGLEGASANIGCHRVCMLHASWHSVAHDLLWMTYKLYYCFRWGRCATKTMAKLECPASASRQAATLATRPSLFFSRHEMRSACFNDFFPDKQAERASRRL